MPVKVCVWVVAVAQYGERGVRNRLDFQVDLGGWAVQFAEAVKARDPQATFLLNLSLPDQHPYQERLAKLGPVQGATANDLEQSIARIPGHDVLLLYWVGHGILADATDRYLLCADSANTDSLHGIDLGSLLTRLRSRPYPRLQLGFLDVCAQEFPQPQSMSYGKPQAVGTEQYFYLSASAGLQTPLNPDKPGFSSTVISALAEAAGTFPPAPRALFDRLRIELDRLPMAARPFKYEWTDGSGDSFSRQHAGIDADTEGAAKAAGLSAAYFQHLWLAAKKSMAIDRLVDIVRNDGLAAHLNEVRQQAPLSVELQLLEDAWTRVEISQFVLPCCRRLGLSLAVWAGLAERIASLDELAFPTPGRDLDALLISVLDQMDQARGRDTFIRLLELAARESNKVAAEALRRKLGAHRLLKPRRKDAIKTLPPADGRVFLLAELTLDASPVSVAQAWIYVGDTSLGQRLTVEGAPSLAHQLDLLLGQVVARYYDKKIVVELMAPSDLLCVPSELLKISDPGLAITNWLEQQYPITVRWLDRMKTRQFAAQWIQISRSLRDRITAKTKLKCAWPDDVMDAHVVGLPFAGPSLADRDRNRKEFFTILVKGHPYMCWPRESTTNLPQFRQRVDTLVGASAIAELAPAFQVAKQQSDALMLDAVLLVDEPERNPYGPQLTEPIQG
ncbi:hypothetical protein GTP91_13305 [Rugamonas sp. FT82W]|uniref:Caspase family protein n=1 Tax=Duganella vulcania TaxID=2692166 RepID=A0A845G0C0_9BURK|nr:hypothetical protein [Duganella vulcania]MYM88153.1 hypothetical protein [Duganella vulcania]